MLTYKEFRKKLLTELDQRGIKFEITSMTSVNGEKERISIAFSNFTTDNAVDSDHKPETFGLYPDHEYANYLGLCESESESPVERIVDDALQIMSQLSEKVSLEYVNSLLKLRDEDIIYQLINADAFHHQQAIFPTEKAVQEYLERSRLYFDLIRLNSYDWDDLTLAELRSVGEIILKDHKKAFVKNPTVEEINHAETLSKNVPDGEDADTILADLCEETSMEEPGLAYDVFNTWKATQTSHERESIEGMFLIFAGIEFGEYLERCIKETTQEGEQ